MNRASKLLLVASLAFVPTLAQNVFKPATFAGLVLGKATVSQAEKRLGAPRDSLTDASGTTWIYYDDIGPVPGRVEFIANSKTGVIESIDVSAKGLTLEVAKAIWGTKFRIAKYDFDACLGSFDAAPLYETPKGQFEYVVYDELGIAINFRSPPEATILEYLSEPLGRKTSQCGPSKRKATPRKK